MKTNFDYLERQLKNLREHSGTSFERHLRDLHFLLKDVEKRIYLREFIGATYPLRMAWDLSRDLILSLVKKSENPTFVKWNKNITDARKSRMRAAEYRGKKFIDAKPGYLTIWNEYPSFDKHIQGVGTCISAINIFNEMNGWMHYRFDASFKDSNNAFNKNDKSTLFTHRKDVRYNNPTMFDVKRYLETLWYVIVDVIIESELFPEFDDYENDFDNTIYNDPMPSLNKLLESKYIDDLVMLRKKCPICKVGKYNIPTKQDLGNRNEDFEYGAYLSCDTEGCWARVDKTLKVKHNLKYDNGVDSTCPECATPDSLQKRSALNISTYVYTACNICSYNSKNENKSTHEIHDWESEIVFDWDEEY